MHRCRQNAFESLESRTLLSATLNSKGTLEITGTHKADTIFVTYGPAALDTVFVQLNRNVSSFKFKNIKRILVHAGALADHVEFRAFALDPDFWHVPSTIYGSTGDDLIITGAGRNRIYGGTGDDKVFANSGRDIIYGEEGNDSLDGGQGNDYIRGQQGNDTLVGGLGSDNLFGDDGDDTFFTSGDLPKNEDTRPLPPQTTFDLVDGGAGKDRAAADPNDRLISVEATFTAT